MNQAEMADFLNLSQSAYSRLERNETSVDFEQLAGFSQKLNIPLQEFLPETISINGTNQHGQGIVLGNIYNYNYSDAQSASAAESKDREIQALRKEVDELKKLLQNLTQTGQNFPPAKSNLTENFTRLFTFCETENLRLFEEELAKICPAEGGTTRIQAGGSPENNAFSVSFFCTPNCPNPGADLSEKMENILRQSPQNESDTLNYCLESVLEKPGKFQINFLMPVEINAGEFAFQFSVKPAES